MTSRFSVIVGAVALATGVFHLLNVAGILVLSTMEVRIIHLAAMMVILFLGKPFSDRRDSPWVAGVLPAAIALAIAIYFLGRWEAIAQSGGDSAVANLVGG